MAGDQLGQGQESKVPWTKIFTAFKVALDVRKLLLAAAGIFAMNLGWVVLSFVFFNTRSKPEVKNIEQGAKGDTELRARYKDFQVARGRWNLLNELAGSRKVEYDIGDIAANFEEFQDLQKMDQARQAGAQPVKIERMVNDKKETTYRIVVGGNYYTIVPVDAKDSSALDNLADKSFHVRDLARFDDVAQSVAIAGNVFKVEDAKGFAAVKDTRRQARAESEIIAELKARYGEKTENWPELWRNYKLTILDQKYKKFGRLSTWVWAEDRGHNPYLLVTGSLKQEGPEGQRSAPWAEGKLLGWLISDQFPVLVEPLIKFLAPLAYLFDARASGFGNRLFLMLVLLWNLLVWGFFGGAITRMAVVQIARNEKISLREAIAFARERCISYFSAPVFPLVFLAILSLIMLILGFIEGHTYFLGDVLVFIFWPIALLLGMIMAVVLVGLVGWPMMNATISAEGSDSFDALSRSYSYVYQAPWHYIWYSFLALLYGAVLIFFIGFMGSLMVYLGKWGLSQAPFLTSTDEKRDRDPTYLFVNAPTSFGWRDLLLHNSPFAEKVTVVSSGGVAGDRYVMSKAYMDAMSWHNTLGSWLVTLWLGLLFLLVVGFGYSYFWTASTIIYLLMRKVVDDTEIDEIHMEEEVEPSMAPDLTASASPAPAAPATVGLQMVDPPALRTPTPPAATPEPNSEPPSANPPPPTGP